MTSSFGRRRLWAALLFSASAGCGARLDPGEAAPPAPEAGPDAIVDASEGGGADANEDGGAEAGLPCAAKPWIIFLAASSASANGAPAGGQLAAMRADGSERHLLALPGDASTFSAVETPSVTPDGAALLYVSGGSIRRFDFATQTDHGLLGEASLVEASTGGSAQAPAASPDGRLLAFTTPFGIHVASADGTGDRTLLSVPDDGCCGQWYERPVFSLDSQSVYFVQPVAVAADPYELDSVGVSGGAPATLGRDSAGGLSAWIQAAFSPDRSRFAAALVCGTQVTLRAYDSAVLTAPTPAALCDVGTLLTATDVAQVNNVSWGPGDRIAFGVSAPASPLGKDVGVVSANGGTVTNLTESTGDALASYPVWADGCVELPLGHSF